MGTWRLEHLRASQERLVALVHLAMSVLDGIQLLQVVADDETLATRHAYILVSGNLVMLSDTRSGAQSLSAIASLSERLRLPQGLKPYSLERLLTYVEDAAARVAETAGPVSNGVDPTRHLTA